MDKDSRFLEKIRSKVGKCVHAYDLIHQNDSILTGLSGGKDSFALLDMLAFRKKYLTPSVTLYAVHIQITNVPHKADLDYLENYCRSLGVPLHIKEIYIDREKNPRKQICFICSWHRRKEIFLLAKELGCNKVAFGHHMDDMIETLLMNMIYHGSFCTMAPKLFMFKDQIEIIRPFATVTGTELQRYANILGYKSLLQDCPHSGLSRREEVRSLIREMVTMNRQAKINLFKSMSHIQKDYLPEEGKW